MVGAFFDNSVGFQRLAVFEKNNVSSKICSLEYNHHDFSNARLIAAAPNMLEMLERLSDIIASTAHSVTKTELSELINRAKNG